MGSTKTSSVPPQTRPVSYFGIVIQVEGQSSWTLGLHHFARRLPDFSFYAAAADRANDRSVVAHQHLRRLERGNRATHVDDGRQRPAPPCLAQSHDLLVQIHKTIMVVRERKVKP